MNGGSSEGGVYDPTHVEGIIFGVEGISQLLQRTGVFEGPHLPMSTKLTLQAPVASAEIVTPYMTAGLPTTAATELVLSRTIEVKLDRKKGNGFVCVPHKDNGVNVPVMITGKGILADMGCLYSDPTSDAPEGISPDEMAVAYEAVVPYTAFIAPSQQSFATPINHWRRD